MQYFVNQKYGVNCSKCFKSTDFVCWSPIILNIESTRVLQVGQDKKFKATSALEGTIFCAKLDYFATVENPEHLENFSIQIILGWHHHSLLKITYIVRIVPIYHVPSKWIQPAQIIRLYRGLTSPLDLQAYVINLPSDHIKLHKWGHHSWDWIEMHLFLQDKHMFIYFLPGTASDQRTFLGSGQPLKKKQATDRNLYTILSHSANIEMFHVPKSCGQLRLQTWKHPKTVSIPLHHQRNSVLHKPTKYLKHSKIDPQNISKTTVPNWISTWT